MKMIRLGNINLIKSIKNHFTGKNVKKTNSLNENGGYYWRLSLAYNVPLYVTAGYLLLMYIPNFLILVNNLYHLVFIYNEVEMAAEVAHFGVLLTNGLLGILVPSIERKHLDNIIRVLPGGVSKYSDTLDPKTAMEAENIKVKMFRRKMMLSRSMEVVYICAGCFAFFILPALSGRFAKPEKQDDLLRQAIVQGHYVYDIEGWPGFLFVSLSQVFMCIVSLFLVNAIDMSFLCYSEEVLYELAVLNLTLRCTTRRARYLYRKMFGLEVGIFKGNKYFVCCLKECLKDTIRHHYAVSKLFDDLRCAYRKIIAITMLSGALMLCMSAVIFLSKSFKLEMKIAFVLYVLAELMHIFLYAYYGEAISANSLEVRESAYSIEWADCSEELRVYLTMVQIYTNTPLKMKSSFGLFVFNYPSFGNVVSSAYSYFNLVSAAVDF